MSANPEECRERAQRCAKLAATAATPELAATLSDIAQKWAVLAAAPTGSSQLGKRLCPNPAEPSWPSEALAQLTRVVRGAGKRSANNHMQTRSSLAATITVAPPTPAVTVMPPAVAVPIMVVRVAVIAVVIVGGDGNTDGDSSRPKRVSARSSGPMRLTACLA